MRLNEKEGQLGSQKENVYRNSVGFFLWGLEDQCVFVRAPEHKSSVQGKSEAPGLFVKNKCGTGGGIQQKSGFVFSDETKEMWLCGKADRAVSSRPHTRKVCLF